MYRLTIPLENLRRDVESALVLDSASNARIVPSGNVSESIRRRLRMVPEFFLEIDSGDDIRDVLDRALVVFKLFKNDPLLANVVLFDDKVTIFEEYLFYTGPDRPLRPEYHLTMDEEDRLSSFWIQHISINRGNFAVYRFHLADFGPYLRPSIVNYVKSMEYLLVPDSGEGEISYRFRSRGAMILGKDKKTDERKRIYHRLKAEYGLRSAIVHGNEEEEQKARRYLDRLVGRTLGWNDTFLLVRNDAREVLLYFHKEGCLDNRKERKRLLEEKLIFGAGV